MMRSVGCGCAFHLLPFCDQCVYQPIQNLGTRLVLVQTMGVWITESILFNKQDKVYMKVFYLPQGRLEVLYEVTFVSPTEDLLDSDSPIIDLIKRPPNHIFMPPLPAPCPPLLCGKKMAAMLRERRGVVISMDSMSPHDCCVRKALYWQHSVDLQ